MVSDPGVWSDSDPYFEESFDLDVLDPEKVGSGSCLNMIIPQSVQYPLMPLVYYVSKVLLMELTRIRVF